MNGFKYISQTIPILAQRLFLRLMSKHRPCLIIPSKVNCHELTHVMFCMRV